LNSYIFQDQPNPAPKVRYFTPLVYYSQKAASCNMERFFLVRQSKVWAGRSADEVLFGVAAYYKFVGFEVLPGYHCYDIFHNKHIKQDLENYPAHLEKVFN